MRRGYAIFFLLVIKKVDSFLLQEKLFIEGQAQAHDQALQRLQETHRQKIALLERQFLQQKHQLLRGMCCSYLIRRSHGVLCLSAKEAALWELEERHLHEKHQLTKTHLKDAFYLQRSQMLLRHQKVSDRRSCVGECGLSSSDLTSPCVGVLISVLSLGT